MLELLDRTSAADQGAPSDPCLAGRLSRGRIHGTSLHNMSMPLLRYDTGDLADFDEQALGCPCGRQFPQIRCVIGRRNDLIVTPDGRAIGTLFLAFNGVPGILVGQFVQQTAHRLLVRIARALTPIPRKVKLN